MSEELEQSEDVLQANCIKWAWNERPQTRRLIWAVPNGGWRNAIEAQKLQATGTLRGVWDVHMFWYGEFVVFEMKVGNNQLTVDKIVRGKKLFGQKEWGDLICKHGGRKFVCRTVEEFKEALDNIIQQPSRLNAGL